MQAQTYASVKIRELTRVASRRRAASPTVIMQLINSANQLHDHGGR